jgi:hypothetical protein
VRVGSRHEESIDFRLSQSLPQGGHPRGYPAPVDLGLKTLKNGGGKDLNHLVLHLVNTALQRRHGWLAIVCLPAGTKLDYFHGRGARERDV